MKYYILDEHGSPKPATIEEWGTMFQNIKGRTVNVEQIGEYRISTVFLGMDHNFSGKGPPILWETMVFGPNRTNYKRDRERFPLVEMDGYTDRCAGTWEQAEAMHKRVAKMVKDGYETVDENKDS